MKASTSNARISAERKRNLSVNEAAELYYKIDEQEGKYLELIKDRKEKIDDLTQKIEDEFEHLSQLQEEVVEKNSMISDLKRRVSSLEVQLEKSESNVAKSESDKALVRQDFEEAVKSAHVVANYFPGILRITELVESANNYHAGEDWLKTKLLEDKKRISEDGYRNMLNFFVAVKMFERKPNGTITFGERFLYEKGLILKMRDNVDQNART